MSLNISVSAGPLAPPFSEGTLSYLLSVPVATESVDIVVSGHLFSPDEILKIDGVGANKDENTNIVLAPAGTPTVVDVDLFVPPIAAPPEEISISYFVNKYRYGSSSCNLTSSEGDTIPLTLYKHSEDDDYTYYSVLNFVGEPVWMLTQDRYVYEYNWHNFDWTVISEFGGGLAHYMAHGPENPSDVVFRSFEPGTAIIANSGNNQCEAVKSAGGYSGLLVRLAKRNLSEGSDARYTITVNRLSDPPVITSPLEITVLAGYPFNYQITATNHPTAFGVGVMPEGLFFQESTGIIYGNLPELGTYEVLISASNADGADTKTLTINVVAPWDLSEPVARRIIHGRYQMVRKHQAKETHEEFINLYRIINRMTGKE